MTNLGSYRTNIDKTEGIISEWGITTKIFGSSFIILAVFLTVVNLCLSDGLLKIVVLSIYVPTAVLSIVLVAYGVIMSFIEVYGGEHL